MTANGTEAPQFTEPDYSYRFEELNEFEKESLGYKRQYMEKLTKKQILRITGFGFLSLMGLVLISGLLVRLIVWIFMLGYNGFGLW